jgi:hypothetical protein
VVEAVLAVRMVSDSQVAAEVVKLLLVHLLF